MARYFVEHHHLAEACPSSNKEMAEGLAGHVTNENAAKYGVRVLSDCVLPGEHTLLMVLEAESPDKVAAFTTPFISVGSVTIKPAITCAVVAARAED
jgi:hypothetical protein